VSFIQVQNEFMQHIRDPANNVSVGGIEDRRLKVYRDLFFNNIQGFLSSAFPVLASILTEQKWQALARTFFASHDCRSPYFIDISKEFVEFLSNEYLVEEGDPPFMSELAHYEWLELDISARHSQELKLWDKEPISSIRFDFSPLAELVSYQWPVHQISPDFQPESPLSEPGYFVVSRDSDSVVSFTQINQVTAHLVSMVRDTSAITLGVLQTNMAEALPQLPEAQVKQATGDIVTKMLTSQIFVHEL